MDNHRMQIVSSNNNIINQQTRIETSIPQLIIISAKIRKKKNNNKNQ